MAKKQIVRKGVVMHGIADKGMAVGRDEEGRTVFTTGAVPGDVVDVALQRKRKGAEFGRVENFISYSPDRVEAPCRHFENCGGCKWQHLDYKAQLKYKHDTVEQAIRRIAGIQDFEMQPIAAAEAIYYYRNKLEYSCSDTRWLTREEIDSGTEITNRNAIGFHPPGTFDKVIDIEHCHLQAEPSNKIRNAIRSEAIKRNWPLYSMYGRSGLLRSLLVRTSTTGQVMVIVVFFENDRKQWKEVLDFLTDSFPEITALFAMHNPKMNDSLADLEPIHYAGAQGILETLDHVSFNIGPKTFFQTNTEQAKVLYRTVREFADIQPQDCVYDLYTGAGSIACYIAGLCRQVVGIEEIPEAVEDARKNAALNKLQGVSFETGDVKVLLDREFIEQNGKPDIVITDPPRAGMHADVVNTLLEAQPEKIVYVSCNPATQARDIALLKEKYALVKIRPVDMFPHTHHIESVALLKRK